MTHSKYYSCKIIVNSFLLMAAVVGCFAQGKWEALGSPVASNIHKMISTTDKKLFINMPYSGIQYSEDLGENWIRKNEGLEVIQGFTTMVAGPNGSVFIASGNKIYKLKNVNSNWEFVNSPGGKIDVIYLGNQKRVFCIIGQEVYVSDDEGLHFNFFLKSPVQNGKITEFAYTGNNENYFIDFTSSVSKLFKFDNQAIHIDSITKFNNQVSNLMLHPNGNLFMSSYYIMYRFNKISKKLEAIKLNQNSNKVIYGFLKDEYDNFISFDTLTYKSSNGGESWVILNQTSPIIRKGFQNYCFMDSLVFLSRNSCKESPLFRINYFDTIFSDLSNTFKNPTIYTFFRDSTNGLFITTCINYPYNYSNFQNTLDEGRTWTNFQLSGKDVLNLKRNNSNKYYAVCCDSTYTSIDFGKTWMPFSYRIYPSENFFIAPDHTIYITNLGGPYLFRLDEFGSVQKFIETGICCDGDINGLLFHPNGRIYINWGGNLFYSDEKGENVNRKNSIQCNSCELTSLGDLYNIYNGLYFVEPDFSNKYLIEPLTYLSKIIGHDKDNNVFVYDSEKGLLWCNKNGCKAFDMTGLPYPFMSIRTIYSDENNDLYAGLYNDKIYKYSERIVSNKNLISSDSESLHVFPNPFSSSLTCEVLKSKTGSYHVMIQDIFGRTMYQSVEKQSHFKIEMESMQPGIYFIRVNNSIFQKIIKI